MSSHREAPEISKDPVADSTDVYAFVSPDRKGTVTLIANYIPLQDPDGGPNFYAFGEEVLYEIHVDNNGDAKPDVTYQFRFKSELRDPDIFLYNIGPITKLDSPNWNRVQKYSVTVVRDGKSKVLAKDLTCPPCNIGPLSTPNYAKLAEDATYTLAGGIKVFAGQRADGFFVDLGSIFDLGDLRPFENLNAYGAHYFKKGAKGVNSIAYKNVHSLAIQVPTADLLGDGPKGKETDKASVIGVYTTASRQRAAVWDENKKQTMWSGAWHQVSRLGNPLVNEALIGIGHKDLFNSQPPHDDKQFANYVAHPVLAELLPALYPGVFPNLAKVVAAKTARADLEAILLTGIPAGIVPGFQNYTGATQADMLRLNTAIPASKKPNILGVVAGDAAGFPNGRRVFDDVVTIELRAIAGLTLPLVDPSFKPDGATSLITDGLTNKSVPAGYLDKFPYLGVPYSGYNQPK